MMWCSYATTAARSRSSSARRMRRAPSAGCRFIKARSESGQRPPSLHFLLDPAHGIRFFAEGIGDRCGRDRGTGLLIPAPHAHGTEPDAGAAHLARLGGVDRGEREPGEHFVEELLELLPAHWIGKLQALDPRERQPLPPVPGLELAQRQPPEYDLIAQEREQRP